MRPNFVFILADDLGYADLGCYGGRSNCSPVLDRMAREGVRFTDGYANSSVCSPTRFALATGRWQQRLRGAADEPLSGRARGHAQLGLPPSHPTLASLLRDAGYATALVGKWHLGFAPHFGPMSGGVDYFTHCDSQGTHDLWENGREVHRQGYLTDLITEKAVSWLAGRKSPFFLSLHYTAPHWPWERREDEAVSRQLGKLTHYDGGSVAIYLEMIRQMDEGIGKVLAVLPESTLVVFTSDNGGERFSDSWPLLGRKMDLLEGGIRVPYVARWPGRIPAGKTSAQLAITMDWVATLLAAAGVAAHREYPLDGISLLENLERPERVVARDLFWRMKFREQKAARSGAWKWLCIEGHEYLFDLSRDPRERANLAGRSPETLSDLKKRYATWEASMPPIPEDAYVSFIGGPADLARPS